MPFGQLIFQQAVSHVAGWMGIGGSSSSTDAGATPNPPVSDPVSAPDSELGTSDVTAGSSGLTSPVENYTDPLMPVSQSCSVDQGTYQASILSSYDLDVCFDPTMPENDDDIQRQLSMDPNCETDPDRRARARMMRETGQDASQHIILEEERGDEFLTEVLEGVDGIPESAQENATGAVLEMEPIIIIVNQKKQNGELSETAEQNVQHYIENLSEEDAQEFYSEGTIQETQSTFDTEFGSAGSGDSDSSDSGDSSESGGAGSEGGAGGAHPVDGEVPVVPVVHHVDGNDSDMQMGIQSGANHDGDSEVVMYASSGVYDPEAEGAPLIPAAFQFPLVDGNGQPTDSGFMALTSGSQTYAGAGSNFVITVNEQGEYVVAPQGQEGTQLVAGIRLVSSDGVAIEAPQGDSIEAGTVLAHVSLAGTTTQVGQPNAGNGGTAIETDGIGTSPRARGRRSSNAPSMQFAQLDEGGFQVTLTDGSVATIDAVSLSEFGRQDPVLVSLAGAFMMQPSIRTGGNTMLAALNIGNASNGTLRIAATGGRGNSSDDMPNERDHERDGRGRDEQPSEEDDDQAMVA